MNTTRLLVLEDSDLEYLGIELVLLRQHCVSLIERFADIECLSRALPRKGNVILILSGVYTHQSYVADIYRQIVDQRHAKICDTSIIALIRTGMRRNIGSLLPSMVDAIILTEDEPWELNNAIHHIESGNDELWLSPMASQQLMSKENQVFWTQLSPRERELMRYVREGLSTGEIADATSRSRGTVRNILSAIYGKIGVRGRAEAVAWAWRSVIVSES